MASPQVLRNTRFIPCWWRFRSGYGPLRWSAMWYMRAGGNAVWQMVATYCIAAEIAGALVAAVPGVIDYFSIDEAAMGDRESAPDGQPGRRCYFCDQSLVPASPADR